MELLEASSKQDQSPDSACNTVCFSLEVLRNVSHLTEDAANMTNLVGDSQWQFAAAIILDCGGSGVCCCFQTSTRAHFTSVAPTLSYGMGWGGGGLLRSGPYAMLCWLKGTRTPSL